MYLIVAELGAVSGLAEDVVVNTFSFQQADILPDADVLDLCQAVQDFYNADTDGAVSSLGNLIAGTVSRAAGACRTKGYYIGIDELDGSPHGSPQVEETWTLDAQSSVVAALPQEVALVLTLEANGRGAAPVEGPGDTRPRSRLTGRIYTGPYNSGQLSSSSDPRPLPVLIERLLDAGEQLVDASVALGAPWAVWSRSNQAVVPLEALSVANDWDTQRRRGTGPTSRTRRLVV